MWFWISQKSNFAKSGKRLANKAHLLPFNRRNFAYWQAARNPDSDNTKGKTSEDPKRLLTPYSKTRTRRSNLSICLQYIINLFPVSALINSIYEMKLEWSSKAKHDKILSPWWFHFFSIFVSFHTFFKSWSWCKPFWHVSIHISRSSTREYLN